MCVPPPNGLVSWWRGEGNSLDAVGTNNGTLQDGATFAPGEVGQAFSLNGEAQCITIPYSSTLAAPTYSVEAWVKPMAQVSNAYDQDLIVGQAYGWQLVLRPGTSGVKVAFLFATSTVTFYDVVGTSELPIGQFSHLVGTWDGTTLRLYINGVLNAQQVPGATPVDLRYSICMGGFNFDFVGQFFNGLIDEVSYYNRALSAGEIAALYNAGSAGKCVTSNNCVPAPAGLVGWWPGEGNANDIAGANNGVLEGGAALVAGEVGQAFQFNGTTQCVSIPYSEALVTTNYSVEAWVKPLAQVSDAINQDLIFGQCYGWQLVARTGTSGVAVAFAFGTSVYTFYEVVSTSEIPIGQFSHLVGTWDGTTLRLYINGTLNAQSVPGATPVDLRYGFYIGGFDVKSGVPYFGQFFNGLIDEPSYYNRALSATEVVALYNADGAGKCVTSNTCAPAPAGLVSWWRGEGNALDSADSNNGTVQGGTTFAPGEVGQAFSFDPSDGTVIVPDSPNLRLTNELTIEAWINNRGTDSDRAIVSKIGGVGGDNGYQMYMRGDKLMAQFNSLGLPWPAFVIESPVSLATGVWYHVAWTYDQSAMKLYVNGLPVATNVVGAHAIAASSSSLRLSGDDNNHVYFDGLIDEPSVYNRALSASEIAAIYNAGSAGKCVPGAPPAIVSQPTSRTALVGATVAFNVTARGDAPLSYQWRFQGAGLAGQTNPSLVIANVQLADGGSYSVVVANALGSVTSSPALLTVIATSNRCVPAPAGLVSWWRGEGNALDSADSNNGTVQGGTTFAPGEVGQAFSFNPSNGTVIVPDAPSLRLTNELTIETWINNSGTNSDRAIVSKIGGAGGNNGYQMYMRGDKLMAQFNSLGLPWPAFVIESPVSLATGVWYHVAWTYDQSAMKLYVNGLPVATNVVGAHPIAATRSTLRLSGDDNNHVYFDGLIDEASLYNRALSASEIAGIYNAGSAGKCGLAPAVRVPPASQTVAYSGNATFSVCASGTPPLSYQWRFGANPVPGATASSLVLTDVTLANAGSYSVVITNLYGSVTGGPAVLTVLPAPACVPAPAGLVSWWRGETNANDSADSNNGVLEGSVAFVAGEVGQAFALNGINADVRVPASASLNVGLADGFTIETWINPADVVQWHPIVEWNNGSFGVNFAISDGTAGHGALWVSVKDTDLTEHPLNTPAGLLASNVWQHVAVTYAKTNGYTVLYINGVPRARAALGVFTPRTIGDLYLGLRPYDGGAGTRFAGLMDEVSLYHRALSAGEIAAIYAAGNAGKCSVGVPPSIVAQPTNQTALVGGTVFFGVSATGDSPLGYQWRFQGANLIGKTSSSLVLADVQLTNAGSYSVVVSNLAGSATSSNALLTVIAVSSNCIAAPAGLVSWWRGEGSAADAAGTNNGVLEGSVGFRRR